jgi:hypothetical protein
MANLTDSIKYLDLTGLGVYDGLIKGVITAGDQANATALDALNGTLAEDDAKTLEAINDELDGIDSEISTLKGDVNTAGSVAKAVKDGIDAIGTGTAQGETGKAIISVTQTNGVVTATAGNINAANVNVNWPTPAEGEDALSATADAQAALIEIFNKIKTNKEAGAVKVFNASNEKVNQIFDIILFVWLFFNIVILTIKKNNRRPYRTCRGTFRQLRNMDCHY